MPDDHRPQRMDAALRATLRKLEIGSKRRSSRLRAAWEKAAPDLPVSTLTVRNGVLLVGLESAALKYEIEALRKEKILRTLRQLLPDRVLTNLRCIVR